MLKLLGRRMLVRRLEVPSLAQSGLYLPDYATVASVIQDQRVKQGAAYDGPDFGGVELPAMGEVVLTSPQLNDRVREGNLVLFPRHLDLRRVWLDEAYLGGEPGVLHELLLFDEDEVYAEAIRAS